jgi:hypothetical protein
MRQKHLICVQLDSIFYRGVWSLAVWPCDTSIEIDTANPVEYVSSKLKLLCEGALAAMRFFKSFLLFSLFFNLGVDGFAGNVIANKETENKTRGTSDCNARAVTYASLKDDSKDISGRRVNGTSTTTGPVLSVYHEFSRPKLIQSGTISPDVTSRRHWLDYAQRESAKSDRSTIGRSLLREDKRLDFSRECFYGLTSRDVQNIVDETVSELEPVDVQIHGITLPLAASSDVNGHDTRLRLFDGSFPEVGNYMGRSKEISVVVYEKSSAIDQQSDLPEDISPDAQDRYDRSFHFIDGLNERVVHLLSARWQGQNKEGTQKQNAAKDKPATPTSGLLTLKNDGRMYGCFIAESSASEVNISCPQINSSSKKKDDQPHP